MKAVYKLIFSFLLAGCYLFSQTPADYKPDFRTADIYHNHLNSTQLSGWWKMTHIYSNNKSELEKFEAEREQKTWTDFLVPDAFPNYRSDKALLAFCRREFELPERKSGERAILICDDLPGEVEIRINGKTAGKNKFEYPVYHGPLEDFRCDITDFLKPGKNLIELRYFHTGINLDYRAIRGIGGIIYCRNIP